MARKGIGTARGNALGQQQDMLGFFDEKVPRECPRCKGKWDVSWDHDVNAWHCRDCGAYWNKDTCLNCGLPKDSVRCHCGLAEKKGITEADVDSEQLRMGIEVEMEHTGDPEVAKRIALDHLAEFDNYYTELEKMEKRLGGK